MGSFVQTFLQPLFLLALVGAILWQLKTGNLLNANLDVGVTRKDKPIGYWFGIILQCALLMIVLFFYWSPAADDSDTQLQPELRFGFTVRAPKGKDWTLQTNDQTRTRAVFRRSLSYPHSFFALVETVQLNANLPLEEQVRSAKTSVNPRFELREYQQQLEQSRGTPCVNYAVRSIDKEAKGMGGVPLHMVSKGNMCIHPTIAGAAVDAHFSERGPAHQLNSALWNDLKYFLDGVHYTAGQPLSRP